MFEHMVGTVISRIYKQILPTQDFPEDIMYGNPLIPCTMLGHTKVHADQRTSSSSTPVSSVDSKDSKPTHMIFQRFFAQKDKALFKILIFTVYIIFSMDYHLVTFSLQLR